MVYKALKNFIGVVSMRKGEVKEISDAKAIDDLLRLNLIEPVNPNQAEATPEAKRGRKPKNKEG